MAAGVGRQRVDQPATDRGTVPVDGEHDAELTFLRNAVGKRERARALELPAKRVVLSLGGLDDFGVERPHDVADAARRAAETQTAASGKSVEEAEQARQAAVRIAAELRQALLEKHKQAEALSRELDAARLAAGTQTAAATQSADAAEQARVDAAMDAKYAAFRTQRAKMPTATAAHYQQSSATICIEPEGKLLSWDNARLRIAD